MFQYFSRRAIKVVMLAYEELRRLGHDYLGVETLLLGLIAERTGVAAKLLRLNSVYLNNARVTAEHLIGLGSGDVGQEIPYNSGTLCIFQAAVEESRQDKYQDYVDTEHLLLSLIKEGDDTSTDLTTTGAFKMLQNLGVEPLTLREQLINIIEQPERETILDPPQSLPQRDEDILTQIADLLKNLSPAAKQELAIRLLGENQNLL